MSGVASAIGGAALIGGVSSYLGGKAKSAAAEKNYQLQLANFQQEQQRNEANTGRLNPYMDAGAQGLGQAMNYDLMGGVGPDVSYDKEYTDKLKDYESSPAFQAQNTLGQQALGRASHNRGLDTGRSGANAQGELTQKLIATDYDKYRGDLGQRYKALQGEYGLRRENNQNRYKQLMDQVGIGQWGLGQKIGMDTRTGAQQASNTAGMANANTAGAGAKADMFTGIGNAASQGLGGWAGASGGAGAGAGAGSMFSQYYDALNSGGSDPFGPPAPK